MIATGETHSVREFCEYCFADAGIILSWSGGGTDEIGWDEQGRALVEVDPRYFRPAEVDALQGDAAKAKRVLGWAPRISLRNLASMMVDHDLNLAEQEAALRRRPM